MTARSFYLPRTLDEATALLDQHGADLTVIGGGTIVMGQVNDGAFFPREVMSLARAGLDVIEIDEKSVRLGSGVTIAAIAARRELGIVREAAARIGGPAVRNTATLGGNLMAGGAYADLAVPLLALDASIELAVVDMRRHMPLDTFLSARHEASATARALITGVSFARPHGYLAYLRLGRRQANTPTVVSVAVRVGNNGAGVCTEARIAVAAGGPHPCRLKEAETALVGTSVDSGAVMRASEAAAAQCAPATDALATAWYRRRMVGVYVRRALVQAMAVSLDANA